MRRVLCATIVLFSVALISGACDDDTEAVDAGTDPREEGREDIGGEDMTREDTPTPDALEDTSVEEPEEDAIVEDTPEDAILEDTAADPVADLPLEDADAQLDGVGDPPLDITDPVTDTGDATLDPVEDAADMDLEADDAVVDPIEDTVTDVDLDASACIPLPTEGNPVEIEGELNSDDLTYHRVYTSCSLSVVSENTYYDVYAFCPVAGADQPYSFLVDVNANDESLTLEDSFLTVYVNSFDPEDAEADCTYADDDGNPESLGSLVSGATFGVGDVPIAVVSNFYDFDEEKGTGSYRLTISTP